MELLTEFFWELVVELLFDASKNKKFPLSIRITFMILLFGIYLFIIGICLIIGVNALKTNFVFEIFMILIAVLILIGFCILIIKKKNEV